MSQDNPFATATPNQTDPANQLAVAGAGGPLAASNAAPAMNDLIDDVSFDSNIKISSLERLDKMKLNEVSRIAFILFDDKNSPMMKRSTVYFDKPQNVIFMAPKNAALNAACTQKWNEPKQRFGAIILKYETDSHGNLLPTNNYDLKAWVFGTDKFPILKQLQKEWGLDSHDLILTCTEVSFQKITIQPAKECLFRSNPTLAAEIIEKARALHNNHLPHKMGAFKTDEEITNILRIAQGQAPALAAGAPSGQAAVNPFAQPVANNPMVNAGAGVGQPSAETFSDLVATGTAGVDTATQTTAAQTTATATPAANGFGV